MTFPEQEQNETHQVQEIFSEVSDHAFQFSDTSNAEQNPWQTVPLSTTRYRLLEKETRIIVTPKDDKKTPAIGIQTTKTGNYGSTVKLIELTEINDKPMFVVMVANQGTTKMATTIEEATIEQAKQFLSKLEEQLQQKAEIDLAMLHTILTKTLEGDNSLFIPSLEVPEDMPCAIPVYSDNTKYGPEIGTITVDNNGEPSFVILTISNNAVHKLEFSQLQGMSLEELINKYRTLRIVIREQAPNYGMNVIGKSIRLDLEEISNLHTGSTYPNDKVQPSQTFYWEQGIPFIIHKLLQTLEQNRQF